MIRIGVENLLHGQSAGRILEEKEGTSLTFVRLCHMRLTKRAKYICN